ncbi:WD domain G-beta repeat uncharacterized protein [Stackebrandtia albiflava]|uniref:WD domain G-beta repeat uncharacterized protein n=1 Tax=Stackebrandtia albiflava TaxID=406432 RepID=A0A562VD05_9ACTN|nr:Hsp70 family protein [Stackebrandtia albiflava]TWJ15728.1 WD domain G-beta repeat uncharacterized protein [Stackebrandtia albiflava]
MAATGSIRLAVDFGTSNTVAVMSVPGRPALPLLFDGSPILPSAIFAGPDRLLTGRDAERAAMSDPAAFEPHPKRCVADGHLQLGRIEVAVPTAIAAVLSRVWQEAWRVAGAAPAELVLTHPAGWAGERLRVLAQAAALAGMPVPRFTPEPVAAATHFAVHLGHRIPAGGHIVVYDLGGGTFDISVVRQSPAGVEVVATGGLTDVGGVDIDHAIIRHLEATYPDADAWPRLHAPQTPMERRHRRGLWSDVRDAKEILSRESSTSLYLPLLDRDALLTRNELETLARPLLDQTVELTVGVLAGAGIEMAQVSGLFLVGGASRMPLSSTLLMRQTGTAPTVLEQPELVVAGGAMDAPHRVLPAPDRREPLPNLAVPVSAPPGPGTPDPVSVLRIPAPAQPQVPPPPARTDPVHPVSPAAPVPMPVPAPEVLPVSTSPDGAAPVAERVYRGIAKVPDTLRRSHPVVGAHASPPTRTEPPPPPAEAPEPPRPRPAEPPPRTPAPSTTAPAPTDHTGHGAVLPGPVTVAAFGPGDVLAGVARSGVLVTGTAPGSPRVTLARHDVEPAVLAWHPTAPRLATSDGNLVKLWWAGRADAGFGDAVLRHTLNFPGEVRFVGWMDDAVVVAGTRTIWLWRPDRSDEPVRRWNAPGPAVAELRALAAVGDRFATGDSLGWIRLWDVTATEPVMDLHEESLAVRALAWSTDGGRLLAGDAAGGLRTWRLSDGASSAGVRGHEAAVRAVAWSTDGALVASAGLDRVVRVAAADTLSFRAQARWDARVVALRFVADDGLVVALEDGAVHTVAV